MKIEFEKSDLDLGYTPVENMFIHTYLGLASGDQIKVYLYALSQLYSGNEEGITNANIAFEMGLTEGQVIDAWSYWIEKGAVEVIGDKYVFKSLRNTYINQMIGIEPSAPTIEDEKKIINDAFSSKTHINEAFKSLLESIEGFISVGRDLEIKLTPKEIDMIENQIKDLNLTYSFFEYAFPLASFEVDSKNVAKLLGVIRNWVIDGATDEEKLNQLLERKQAQKAAKPVSKASKKSAPQKDDRMSREERRKFIEEKMKNRNF